MKKKVKRKLFTWNEIQDVKKGTRNERSPFRKEK